MGKRGPRPKGEFSNKSKVLSTRIRQDTRDRLERAALSSGRSLSQEIEYRLRRSFLDDDRIADSFGSRRNYALMRTIALLIDMIGRPSDLGKDWLDEPYLFDQVTKAVKSLLESVRPDGEIEVATDPIDRMIEEDAGSRATANILLAIQRADPSVPLVSRNAKQHLAAMLKDDLGAIAARPKIFVGTAEDARRIADEMDAAAEIKKQKRGKST